jgi:hypothetical protein
LLLRGHIKVRPKLAISLIDARSVQPKAGPLQSEVRAKLAVGLIQPRRLQSSRLICKRGLLRKLSIAEALPEHLVLHAESLGKRLISRAAVSVVSLAAEVGIRPVESLCAFLDALRHHALPKGVFTLLKHRVKRAPLLRHNGV